MITSAHTVMKCEYIPLSVIVTRFSMKGGMAMHTKETFCFAETDELSLYIDAYIPDKPNGAAVLYYHGGAGIVGSRTDIMASELFLNRGFTYLSPDYRLAPEVPLQTLVGDTEAAYAWLMGEGARRFHIDPARVGIAGCSFGGYLSQLLAVRLRPRPVCALSYAGYGDLMGAMYAKPDPFYISTQPAYTEAYALAQRSPAPLTAPDEKDRMAMYFRARQLGAWNQLVAGLDPVSDFDALLPYCPVRMMTADTPPVFLIHGEADTDVSPCQAYQTAAMLASLDVRHRLIMLPCGHGVYGEGADEALRASVDFLAGFTGAESPNE